MMEIDLQLLAKNLRKPEGDFGSEVGKMMNDGNALLNHHTRNQVAPEAGDHILEIGMGNGMFVGEILSIDPTIRYKGVDYSELMTAESIANNQQYINEGRAEFIVGNAASLPFDNDVFTKIFTVNTIYFWDDHDKTLAELNRVLKPNGTLHIGVYSKQYMSEMPFTQYNFRLFDNEEIISLLNTNGFRFDNLAEHREQSNWTDNIIGNNILIFTARKH